jgi:photosystem II stability/assembly factor-like uncharacterized protein
LPTNVQAISANETSFFAAVLGFGVYRSSDNGASWQESLRNEEFNLQSLIATSFGALALGYDKDFLQMLFYRYDGQQWSAITTFTDIGTNIKSIAEVRGTIYIATEEDYGCSTDRGATWQSCVLPQQSILSSLVETPAGLFITTGNEGVYALPSATSTPTWTKAASNGLPNGVTVVSLAAASDNLFALTSNGAVYRSRTNGDSWEAIANGLPNGAQVRSLSAAGASLLAQVSTDNNVSVYLFANGAWSMTSVPDITTEALLAANSKTMCCVVPLVGVFRTPVGSTGNVQWQESNAGLPKNVGIMSFAASGAKAYLSEQNGKVYQSSDNGASWQASSSGLPSGVRIVSLLQTPSGVVAGSSAGRVYRLANTSSAWQAVTGFPAASGSVDILFAVGSSALLAGVSPKNSSQNDPSQGDVSQSGVFISNDNGTTWRQTLNQTGSIVGATSLGSSLFIATNGKGILRSNDGGTSWQDFNAGLIALPEGYGLQGIGTMGGMVYVGMEQAAIGFTATYQSDGSTAQWQQANNIPVSKCASATDGAETLTFAATPAGSIFRVEGDNWQEVGRYGSVQTLGVGDGVVFAGTNAGLYRAPATSVLTSVRTISTLSKSCFLSPNPSTAGETVTIRFVQNRTAAVTVRITNTLGQTVATVPQGIVPNGERILQMQAPSNLSRGMYWLSIDADGISVGGATMIIKE